MTTPVNVQRTASPKAKPDDATLKFGTVFTDHMFLEDYDARGWVNGRIEPYHHLSLDPAAAVLHYGQEIFEGLKAFRGVDGRVRLFRPRRRAFEGDRAARRLDQAQQQPAQRGLTAAELTDQAYTLAPAKYGSRHHFGNFVR